METRDARTVLRLLQAAFPQYPNAQGLPEDSAELYLRMLCETDARGGHLRLFADAMEATRHWVLAEDHFPLVGELLDAIQREARKRMSSPLAGGLPEAWAGLPAEELPPGPAPERGTLDDMTRAGNVTRLREVLQDAVKRAPVRKASPAEVAQRVPRPPEPCPAHDHSLCGAGPALARPKPKQ